MFDPTDRPTPGALAVADRPVPPERPHPRETARALIGQLLARRAAETAEAGEAARACLHLAIEVLHARSAHDYAGQLAEAARRWAQDDLSLDVVHSLHATLRDVLNRIGAGDTGVAPGHYEVVVAAAKLVAELIDTVSTEVMGACSRQFDRTGDGRGPHDAAVSALLRGDPLSEIRTRYGLAIADDYRVLAFAAQPTAHSGDDDPASSPVTLLRDALADRTGGAALSAMSATGGTILLPDTTVAPRSVEHLVAEIGRAARMFVTATLVDTPVADIAGAAERAHELLDIVQRLELPRGLYGFEELALEYQLTRPGPAQAHLSALLAPLADHPELLRTLRCHIASDLHRRRTGEAMHLHPNTVDYRLRRIAELTGFHAHRYPDLWYLRSALVVHSFRPDRT